MRPICQIVDKQVTVPSESNAYGRRYRCGNSLIRTLTGIRGDEEEA
jgi:hypothetical protein